MVNHSFWSKISSKFWDLVSVISSTHLSMVCTLPTFVLCVQSLPIFMYSSIQRVWLWLCEKKISKSILSADSVALLFMQLGFFGDRKLRNDSWVNHNALLSTLTTIPLFIITLIFSTLKLIILKLKSSKCWCSWQHDKKNTCTIYFIDSLDC